MDSVHRAGRIIGVLIIIQLAGAAILKALQAPFFEVGGFLANAAPHVAEIATSALLTLVVEALWVGLAVMAFPVLYGRVPRLALLLAALTTVILAAACAEVASVQSLIFISDSYLKAPPAAQEELRTVRVMASSARNGIYNVARLLDGAAAFVFYAALLRAALVPRWLARFGLVAAVSWIASAAVTFFGHHVMTLLLVPLALSSLILAPWLVVNGFPDGDQRTPAMGR